MYLKQVEIKNFRNLEQVTISLQTGLNAIVGPNNVGKTNLFLAIRHALGSASARGEPLLLSQDDLFRRPGDQPRSSIIRVDLTFSELTDDQIAQFFEILDYDPAAPQSSTARVHFEATWLSVKKRFAVQRWGGRDEGERTPQVPFSLEYRCGPLSRMSCGCKCASGSSMGNPNESDGRGKIEGARLVGASRPTKNIQAS